MDIGKLNKFVNLSPQRYLGAGSDKAIEKLVKLALVAGLYIGILYLPVLSFSAQGGQSLSDVLWYAVVGGMDRSYWLTAAPVHYFGAVAALILLFIALAAHIAGLILQDPLRTFGGGAIAAICLVALLPLARPLASGMLDAMAWGLPIAILYLAAVMGWEGYARFASSTARNPSPSS